MADETTPQDDPLYALKKLKAQQAAQQADPLAQLKALKNAPPPVTTAPAGNFSLPPINTPSALDKIGDAAKWAFGFTPAGILTRAVTHPMETAMNVGQSVPGGKAAEAGFAMLGSRIPGMSSTGPMTYADALSSIDGATKDTPLASKLVSQIPGAMIAGKMLPSVRVPLNSARGFASGAAKVAGAGAALSGANRALSATDESLPDRLAGTAGAAATGAVIAPVAAAIGTALGTLAERFGAGKLGALQAAAKATRSTDAATNYGAFRDLGDLGGKSAPLLTKELQQPIVQQALKTVQTESPTLGELPATDASVLDAVRKKLSQKAWAAAQGYNLTDAVTRFDTALEEAAAAKGGTYAAAREPFAQASAEIAARKKGALALRNAASPTIGRELGPNSPATFADWIGNTPSSGELDAAREGVAGALQREPIFAHATPLPFGLNRVPLPFPSSAIRQGGALLDQLDNARGVLPNMSGRNAAIADLLARLHSQ